jgi:transposase
MDIITELLNLEDADITVSDIRIEGTKKILTLDTALYAHYCPCCGFRMYSRGVRKRKIIHPILQDGYELILILRQRRWKCSNPDCLYTANEAFRFVDSRRRTTNASDILIVRAFRDLSESSASIAKKFMTSDTHVLEVFDRYVRLDRLPLSDIISVDEVYVNMGADCKYALVIQDFYTGDPIDVLRSRKTKVTEPYFASIPIEERKKVRYLISDMYNPYIAFVDKYFPNAAPVVDSFHVVQWIIHSLDMYIRSLERKYRDRDRKLAEEKSAEAGHPVRLPMSREVYLLKKYKWLILSNLSNIKYHTDLRMDKHLHCMMNTYDYESSLFSIDPHLKPLRDLKEEYIQFNTRNAGDPGSASRELDPLIRRYMKCRESIFQDYAVLLNKYRDPIINSFIMVQKYGSGGIYDSRLSNGPIESLNRKVKDLKRLGRGFSNFEHFRNRFLYAERNRPVLDGRSDAAQVQYFEEEDS